jgi:hypothetical protein
MKKLYLLFLPLLFIIAAGCSKDFLKHYDDRIEGGTWTLQDVNSFGLGSRYSLAFTSGSFRFLDNGELEYVDDQGNLYQGSWNIRKEFLPEQTRRQLHVSVVNFQTQELMSEIFDDMQFTGTDRFKAFIYAGSRTYTFKFRR